ncbi:MAG: bacterial proteasome activator family protein [Actinomycetota bacterium]|nr:bacterial proteasome activator family protein [Actinomycetota bacterium]
MSSESPPEQPIPQTPIQPADHGNQVPADRPLDPAKVLRMASLVREVLDEVRKMSPSKETASHLAELYGRVKTQLSDAMPEFLASELDAIELDMPFKNGATTEDVRVAYSALMGWLGGLFQGLQASFQAHHQMQLARGQRPEVPDMIPTSKEGYL